MHLKVPSAPKTKPSPSIAHKVARTNVICRHASWSTFSSRTGIMVAQIRPAIPLVTLSKWHVGRMNAYRLLWSLCHTAADLASKWPEPRPPRRLLSKQPHRRKNRDEVDRQLAEASCLRVAGMKKSSRYTYIPVQTILCTKLEVASGGQPHRRLFCPAVVQGINGRAT